MKAIIKLNMAFYESFITGACVRACARIHPNNWLLCKTMPTTDDILLIWTQEFTDEHNDFMFVFLF